MNTGLAAAALGRGREGRAQIGLETGIQQGQVARVIARHHGGPAHLPVLQRIQGRAARHRVRGGQDLAYRVDEQAAGLRLQRRAGLGGGAPGSASKAASIAPQRHKGARHAPGALARPRGNGLAAFILDPD
ncbi:hypothetical protein WJ970_15290 [Achromobacter xylosoxidans]